jgi:hypothetical protein
MASAIADSVYAEIRVSENPLQEPGSFCYFFIAYRCDILGGVIDEFCITPMGSDYGVCEIRDYVIGCYFPPEPVTVDSVGFHFDETFDGVDTADVIVEVYGFMPDERLYLNHCAMQNFSYVDTLRAPVKRGSSDYSAPRNGALRRCRMRPGAHCRRAADAF